VIEFFLLFNIFSNILDFFYIPLHIFYCLLQAKFQSIIAFGDLYLKFAPLQQCNN